MYKILFLKTKNVKHMHVLSSRLSQITNNRSFQHSHFPESSDSPLWYSRETSVFQVLKKSRPSLSYA